MIKYTVFLNGSYLDFDKDILKDSIIYCVDGGANIAYKYGILPHYIIGDLDSIDEKILKYYENKNVNIIKYPKNKDYTDFELCLLHINNIENIDIQNRDFSSVDEFYSDKIINVFGALGNRIDMSLSNMNLLKLNKSMVFYIDKNELMYYKDEPFNIFDSNACDISFIPITNISNLTLKGFEYDVENENISEKIALVSNKIVKKEANVYFSKGDMFVIKKGDINR